jgi:hypothetical protein
LTFFATYQYILLQIVDTIRKRCAKRAIRYCGGSRFCVRGACFRAFDRCRRARLYVFDRGNRGGSYGFGRA